MRQKCDNNKNTATNNYKGLQGQLQALQGQVSHFLSCFNCNGSPKGSKGKTSVGLPPFPLDLGELP